MNPEPVPQDLIAVHDLLKETLATARDNGAPFGYGVAVFPRTGQARQLIERDLRGRHRRLITSDLARAGHAWGARPHAR